MKKELSRYFMTALTVACLFRAGPDIEASAYPVIHSQSIEDVSRPPANPVISDQAFTEVRRENDRVCYTWTFTKRREVPLSYISFSVQDKDGVLYDAETVDADNGKTLYTDPNKVRWPTDKPIVRHFCTSLPYINDPLTVKGVLVYKTWINLWHVTHFTPTIVVPKAE